MNRTRIRHLELSIKDSAKSIEEHTVGIVRLVRLGGVLRLKSYGDEALQLRCRVVVVDGCLHLLRSSAPPPQ